MNFNPYTIPAIITFFFSLLCGVFVITKNPHSHLHRILFFICIDIAGWFSMYIPINFEISESTMMWSFRICYCFISFLPIMIFTFITYFLDLQNSKTLYRINSAIGLILCILSLTSNFIVEGINYLPWHPYPRAGILHIFLVLHCFILAFYSLKLMLQAMNVKGISLKRMYQLKYMFVAVLILTVGSTDFLSNYNLTFFYPFGCITAIIFLIIITVAVLKYQLIDIQIALKKSLIYSFLITTITLIYLLAVFISERIFHNYIGYRTFTGSLISATLIAIIFIPLRNRIQIIIDKIFFKGSPSEIARENELLRQEVIQTEKFKAVATLASGIAHEIRNPLTAIKTFNEFLLQKKDDPKFLQQYHDVVARESDRINALVTELLMFAKPTPPQMATICPTRIIEELIALIEKKCTVQNIAIHKDYKTQSTIQADPNQLKQALLNIMLNALDAMPGGGQLNINTSFENNTYIIKIHDTGCGIDDKDLPHIFEPFYTKKVKGTGLGLSITQGIIEKHGGKITVTSQINLGTTFIIHLKI